MSPPDRADLHHAIPDRRADKRLDCSRPETTAAVTRGALRTVMDLGLAPITEFVLPDGLRADIAALGTDGSIWIVEVKANRADFVSDKKWDGYRGWCDRFVFAVDARFPLELLPDHGGVIVADGYGGALVRQPAPPGKTEKLTPARRKSLLIRFGRAAAFAATRTCGHGPDS